MEIGQQVGLDHRPANQEQGAHGNGQPSEHDGMREPDLLGVRQAVQLLVHVAVDGVVADGLHQDHRQEGDRQERHRGLPEAEDDPGPLGVGDLVHGGQRQAAAGDAGPEDPVDVEDLPGTVSGLAVQGQDEEGQPDGGEDHPAGRQGAPASGHRPLGQAFAQRFGVHQLPPAGSGWAACRVRT